MDYDVVVVGGTPAGISAAIAAARRGCSVALLERSGHLGGLCANGLGATDIQTRGATGGLFLEFTRRIRAHYADSYGDGAPELADCRDGYLFEPHVAELVLEGMLADHSGIVVRRERQFDADPANILQVDAGLAGVEVSGPAGARERYRGRTLIDATYEGDVAAAAGAAYRLGREDAREHGEPLAGVVYKGWKQPAAPESTGLGDNAIQSYNYRLCLTMDPARRFPIPRPEDYRRADYVSLIEDIRQGRWAGETGHELHLDGIGRVVNLVALPNGKYDANNQHLAWVSTDLPEENWPWPTAGWAWRDAFARRLRDYTLGLLWFCQNDPALPADFRGRCAPWGLPADEYRDNGHFSRQVYVREARRVVGSSVFTAHDTLPGANGERPPVHRDAITASHYPLDSHAVRKREPGRPHLDGFFNLMNAPYTVPFGVMVPPAIGHLLVPVAASATHVGFSTLRMEPCWMALGEAAGTAAALAVAEGCVAAAVPIDTLQEALLGHGAVLTYFRDMPVGAPGFAASQRLAVRGILNDWYVRPEARLEPAEGGRWAAALTADAVVQPGETRQQFLARLSSPRSTACL